MMFVWIFFVAFLLIALQSNKKSDNKTTDNRIKAILLERFASGEINRQQYQQMLATLETRS